MTRAELAACAHTLTQISDMSDTITLENAAIKARQSALAARDKQMDATRATLDRTSRTKVNQFNQTIDSLREEMRVLNQDVDRYNAKVGTYNADLNGFNADCVSRPYRVADLDVLTDREKVLMERGAAPFDLPVYSDESTSLQNGQH